MKLQQLRFLCEVVDQGFNISRAAEALYTSQPGISRQIGLLEAELNVELILRRGNRLLGLTSAGTKVVEQARRALNCAEAITAIGRDFSDPLRGSLTIATTHTHARYVLPGVIRRFSDQYPAVSIKIIQGLPGQIANWVHSGEADIGLATRPAISLAELVFIQCYEVEHVLIAPVGHPLLKSTTVTLDKIAQYPLISYDDSYQISKQVLERLQAAGISANVVMRASDSDIIKTYVATGLGIAIIPQLAYNRKDDRTIRARGLGETFQRTVAFTLVRRGAPLRQFTYDFLGRLSTSLTRDVIDRAIGNE